MTVFDTPGLLTDVQVARNPQSFFDRGYRWIVRQAQNDVQVKDGSLPAYRAAGFKTGVWGVSYSVATLSRDALLLTAQAKDVGADLLVWDVEECLKGADRPTVASALETFAAFKGEKALTTLGLIAGNVPIDLFLKSGWHVLPQAYWHPTSGDDGAGNSTTLRPDLCVAQAQRVGVPLDRLHLMINSGGPLTPSEHLQALNTVPFVTPDISVFMAEFGPDALYDELRRITMRLAAPTTPTPVSPDAASTRAEIIRLAVAYETAELAKGNDASRTRIRTARAVIQAPDPIWTSAGPAVRTALGLPT